jgi:peptidoglycan/LPS O-acetylase OafA/YrhL
MKTVSPRKTEKKNSEKKSNENQLNISYKIPVEKLVILLCLLTSISVIIGWFLGYEKILSIIPESATMKFNTAIVFLIAGINLIIFSRKEKIYRTAFTVLSIIAIFIGTITLANYLDFSVIKIDNLLVKDVVSDNNPGRMSPATALCSILLGFGFLGFKSHKLLKSFSRNAVIILSIISLLSILSYILLIPSENKTSLFQTMAIHTAVLFFVVSIVLILKSKNSILYKMMTDQLGGSQIFRHLLPKVIIFPLILGNLLLVALNKDFILK